MTPEDLILQGLADIKEHLRILNGSVLSLKLWRAYLTGAVSVIVIIMLPVLGFLALQVVHNSTQISSLLAESK